MTLLFLLLSIIMIQKYVLLVLLKISIVNLNIINL